MARKVIEVDGRRFGSKKELKDYVRAIVARYSDDQLLSRSDLRFMKALLENHRWRDEKVGVGIALMTVKVNRPFATRGFWLTRFDGTTTDFSWLECIDHPSQRKDVLAAMRAAVADQKQTFRTVFFATTPNPRCPLTGKPLSEEDSHVDHEAPLTFQKLAEDFIAENKIDVDAVVLHGYGDGNILQEFADLELKRIWQVYHRRHAKLRMLSPEGNLSIAKRASEEEA